MNELYISFHQNNYLYLFGNTSNGEIITISVKLYTIKGEQLRNMKTLTTFLKRNIIRVINIIRVEHCLHN